MKNFILITILLLSISMNAQVVKEFNINSLVTYHNGYESEVIPTEGKATLKLFENSGSLVIQFTDGETKFTFTEYKYVSNKLFISIPKAKFYNGGKYKFTGELLINLKGVIDLMNPKNGYKVTFR